MESSEGHAVMQIKIWPYKISISEWRKVVKPTQIAYKLNSFFTTIGSKLAAKFQTIITHIDQTDLVEENFSF